MIVNDEDEDQTVTLFPLKFGVVRISVIKAARAVYGNGRGLDLVLMVTQRCPVFAFPFSHFCLIPIQLPRLLLLFSLCEIHTVDDCN